MIYETAKIVSKKFFRGQGGDIGDFSFISADIEIGDNVHIASNVKIIGQGKVRLEEGVTIAPGVVIYTSQPNFKETGVSNRYGDDFKNLVGNVIIKKNAFIGANSVVGLGITIGENAIIGAMSFVNKDVPARMLAVGIPITVKER